jgi:hypothetical protein
MPRNTPRHDDQPDPAMLAEVAAVLEQLAGHRRADAARAALGAAALRGGDAGLIGGEAARARLATLALRMLAQPEIPPSPAVVARFLSRRSGSLGQAPIDLVRTAAGAERVRRLVELEPPLPPPDPERVARAEELDDLTPEEAYAAYAQGRIASPRLMALTGLRGIGTVMAALTARQLRLPRRPTPVGPGRNDRDLLWEHMGGREDPALTEREPDPFPPAPAPGPELDAIWPAAMPDDAASLEALAGVAAALGAEAAEQERQAARAIAAAAGLRGDAAAVGGEAAQARLCAWAAAVMKWRAGDGHPAFGAAWFLLQPLLGRDPPFAPLAGGDGALELARTAEGAAMVEAWMAPPPGPDPARVVAATDLGDLTADEAYAAYADGRIDSRRLTAATGVEDLFQIWGQLALRGLKLPVVPTYVGPGRDDRDLLWESMAAGPDEQEPSLPAERP